MPQGKVRKLADFQNGKAILYDTVLEDMVTRYGVQSLPTKLISIGGVARSGKSFLLNLFVSLLTYIEEHGSHSGWEKSNYSVEGLNWAKSRDAVTLGMWIWDKPFIITRADGTKVAILLVDSQGTGDNKRGDTRLDTLIMYVSLRLSTKQILNIKGDIKSHDLFGLQLVADYADYGDFERKAAADDFLFSSLVLVMRDWQHDDIHGEDPHAFSEMLGEQENRDLLRVGHGIKRAFKHITTHKMPYPGTAIAFASAGTRKWGTNDIPANFLSVAKKMMLSLCIDQSGGSHECWASGEELLASFKLLQVHLERADLPQITSPADALQETIVQKGFIKAQDCLQQTITKLISKLESFPNIRALETRFEQEKVHVLKVFQDTGRYTKYGGSKIWRKYQGMLNNGFETDFEHLQSQYRFSLEINKLKKQNQRLRADVERQNAKHSQEVQLAQDILQATQQSLAESERKYKEDDMRRQAEMKQIKNDMLQANEAQRKQMEGQLQEYEATVERERQRQNQNQQHAQATMNQLNTQLQDMENCHAKRTRQSEEQMANIQQQFQQAKDENDRLAAEAARKSKLDPVSKFFRRVGKIAMCVIPAAVVGFFAGGPAGAFAAGTETFISVTASEVVDAIAN